jgi:glutamine synthetase|tara:strand:+ start:37 stop:468 length:432 start_codon:yes stop_codon:yes gene_type:complete
MDSVSTAGKTALDFMRNIDQRGRIIAEYVWIDGDLGMRSKTRTLPGKITSLDQLPEWNYDGSSCYQAETENSEVLIKPVAYYPDPFRGGDNIFVLCEGYKWADSTFTTKVPVNTNFRAAAVEIFNSALDEEPWFGIEQEYTLL